jgi:TRAP-type uncharacterized transport system substrate-binding protein
MENLNVGALVYKIQDAHAQSIKTNFALMMRDQSNEPSGYALMDFARQTVKNDARMKRALDTIQNVLWIDE